MRDLIEALVEFAQTPRGQSANTRLVAPDEAEDDGLRLQDPGEYGPEPPRPHRLPARLFRAAQARHEGEARAHRYARSACSTPQFFFAQDRAIAEEAYAGDIVGIPNHGMLRIGDTLTEGEEIAFRGVPSFAPEILRRIKLQDAMKGKKLREALSKWRRKASCSSSSLTMARPPSSASSAPCSSTCSSSGMRAEYGLPIAYEETRFQLCRWIEEDPELERFAQAHASSMARDLDGAPVFMAASNFDLTYQMDRWPSIRFSEIKAYQATGARGELR